MKNINKYIQFSVDNWLEFWDIKINSFLINEPPTCVSFKDKIGWQYSINIIELITSKSFIEKIAKWYCNKYCEDDDIEYFNEKIDEITREQAKAIRDSTLDYFINKIIKYDEI